MYLTVYFNGQFWCGLIEIPSRQASSSVYHYIFGPEPKTAEIFVFIYTILPQLIATTKDQDAPATLSPKKRISPKRMQRMLNRQKKQPAVSTKSQLVLQQQYLEKKVQTKKQRKEQKQQQKQQRFEQKQQKKYAKHRGH